MLHVSSKNISIELNDYFYVMSVGSEIILNDF